MVHLGIFVETVSMTIIFCLFSVTSMTYVHVWLMFKSDFKLMTLLKVCNNKINLVCLVEFW